MKLSEFKIGESFNCSNQHWRCTDVGTRTIIAICLTVGRTKDWFIGPPYAVTEIVFDEFDFPACSILSLEGI